MRLCIDFRKLNQQTKYDSYPLPRINELPELRKNGVYDEIQVVQVCGNTIWLDECFRYSLTVDGSCAATSN
ncbi:5768_t:CDS:2, partial [Racocetra fulgida]